MNLKKRLVISNATVVIVPVIITIIASFVFIFIYNEFFNGNFSYDNMRKISVAKTNLNRAHYICIQEKVNISSDKNNFEYIKKKFIGLKVDMIITKGQESIFSSKNLDKIDIEKLLNDEGIIDGVEYLTDAVPFRYKDGSMGQVILYTPTGTNTNFFWKTIFFIITVFIGSFIITNTIMSLVLSKKILKPVQRLQAAALEISQGNLEYEVIEDGDIEIRELCSSFEKMRLKLKEATTIQKKYDENRKMLVSSISHDLRTPITSIKGYVEGIRDGVADSEEKVNQYLDTIYSKASHIDLLIDDLLFYSKLDIKKIKFDYEKTDILMYFKDCITECEYDLIKAGIKITLKNELSKAVNVMLDRERMRRVIINIIENSRKYMNKENGEITITLREVSKNVVAEIRDNGIGISKEDLPHIFDRFYRADTARSPVNGSGLGLAIAKQIVEGHEGRIWALSDIGLGTSIMISLKKTEY